MTSPSAITSTFTRAQPRALIDAARRDLDYEAKVAKCDADVDAITRNVDELRALNAPITRHAAFALVERELRETRVHEIDIGSDEHGPFVGVRAYGEDMSETVLTRDTLLEAVDAVKAKAR